MAEYIERDALVGQIIYNMAEFVGAPDDVLKHDEQCNYAISCVESAPAADVVPVVRCKDCTHYDMGVCLKIYSDGSVHPVAWHSRRPEDFCSYGERKDRGAENG